MLCCKCKFSTIANYLNGLVSTTTYVYANLEPSDALLAMEPSPLTQLINLRGQAEKASKTQQMYEKRVGGWLEWPQVQQARVAAMSKLDKLPPGESAAKRNLLRDCCAISLLSLIPPDRVGCIRKLRLKHTLKRKSSGGFMMDLSKQRDGHKTSRFYGPFAASLPSELTPILEKYCGALEFDTPDDSGPYLFHPPQGGSDRPMDSSSWSQWVSRLFTRHAGEAIAPKTLRSIFITWLRSNTDSPAILKAAAHAMKHSGARQASSDYDQESDDRLVKAAYDFNLRFAAGFASSAAGSSSDAPPPPAAADEQPVAAAAAEEAGEYEVHAILQDKVSAGKAADGFRKGAKLFLVQWVGYTDPSWELASNVGKAAVDLYEERKRSGAPPPPPSQRNTSRILPPVPRAELRSQLSAAGFERGEAAPDGDCFPLSAMAGFEISAVQAARPDAAASEQVRGVRAGAVGIITGDEPIDGVPVEIFRESEYLPRDADAASAALAPWLQCGHWAEQASGEPGNRAATFQLGVAMQLGRQVAVEARVPRPERHKLRRLLDARREFRVEVHVADV